MVKKIQINLGNKTFYTLIAFISLILIGGIVFAYNTVGNGNPSVMGHSLDEIEGVSGGAVFVKCQLKLSPTPVYPTCPTGFTNIHSYTSFTVTGWYGDYGHLGRGIDVAPEYTCQIPPCIKQGSIGTDNYWVYHTYNGQYEANLACSVCEKN